MKLMNFFALNLLGNGEHCAHWWRRHGARKNMVKPIGMPNRNLVKEDVGASTGMRKAADRLKTSPTRRRAFSAVIESEQE